MIVKTQEAQALYKLVEEDLQKFPLYEPNEEILIEEGAWGIDLSYPVISMKNFKKTQFHINIKNSLCYITKFHIEEEKQRQGYGTQMYQIIEYFSIKLGCAKIKTNLSENGGTIEFFKAMGFKKVQKKYYDDNTYVKRLD